MIDKGVTREFLARKLNSYSWIKRYSKKQLRAEVMTLDPKPDFGAVKPWAHQYACFLILLELQRFMLHVDMGGGKALPLDELVLTPTGWRKIGDLNKGDYVIGSNGNATKVTGVFPQGMKEIFKVAFSDRTTINCCEEHLWAVTTPTRRWRGRAYNIKPLKELIGDLRDTNGWRKWFIPVVQPVEFSPCQKLQLDPYFLGAWLGDGCRLSTSITSPDQELIDKIMQLLPKGMCVTKSTSPDNKASAYNFKNIKFTRSNYLRDALRSINLFDKYSYERFIPKEYLFASIKDRIALLQGLVDTDGYITKDGKCYFDSSSSQLANDFAHLVRSLGGTATVSDHKPNAHKGHYSIYFVTPPSIMPCSLTRRVNRLIGTRRRANQPTRAIEAITPAGKANCVCISVDAADGLFVAKDFTVTHNTLLTLMLIKYLKQRGDRPRVIVFVPYLTAVLTWIEQAEEHAPDLKVVPLLGSGEENLRALESKGDIFVIAYPSAVAMVSRYDKKKKGWNFKAEEIRQYFGKFNMLVMDEIHKCKNVTSLTYRMCRAIAANCEWALGLTGTPFGRDLQDLWPQYYLIDFGETLGSTMGFYREVYFERKPAYRGFVHKFNKKLLPDLKKAIRNSSISYSIDEFYDMPPLTPIIKKLRAHPDAFGYIQKALEKLKEGAQKKQREIVKSNYLILRQLGSGFMTLKGEDDGKIHVQFDDNPKLEALLDIIGSMPHGTKMVVFHHFRYTNKVISDKLKELKIGHARVWGGQKTDPLAELRRFKSDAKVRILVINSKSGSSSLNLQHANYVVFFEQPDNPIDRQQAERRVWRPGQVLRVFMYDLLMKGTGDINMHRANAEGESLLKKLIHGQEVLK